MRIRLLLGVFVVSLVAGPIVFFGGLYLAGRSPSYCDDVALPEAVEWRALDDRSRLAASSELVGCGRLDDLSAAQAAGALGAPDDERPRPDGSTLLVYAFEPDGADPAELQLRVDDDRVVGAGVTSSSR